MRYSFYQVYSDPTTYSLPTTHELEATSKEAAIQQFARQFRVRIETIGREDVWMLTQDDASVRYLVTETG